MPERAVCDGAVRERVTTDLDTCFLLEAGAGTGKTRVLVDRYVSCVLDPQRGTGDVRTVAAITFTEKAAGELRQRVREEFERRAVEATGGSSGSSRWRPASTRRSSSSTRSGRTSSVLGCGMSG
jgi:ATP-dependent exoDNAse (exonuclease V) beta subunit